MTKEAVRALALKLELHRARHLIDIGAGSVSIELLYRTRRCG